MHLSLGLVYYVFESSFIHERPARVTLLSWQEHEANPCDCCDEQPIQQEIDDKTLPKKMVAPRPYHEESASGRFEPS